MKCRAVGPPARAEYWRILMFGRMKSKLASLIQRGGLHPQSEDQKRRALIGEILLAEYETAQTEFDRERENPGTETTIQTCGKSYMEATARLRKFLTDGE